jgi:hypothetical protein
MTTRLRIFALLSICAVLAYSAAAQGPQLRTVRGVVMDKSDSPIASAVVFLKNTRTNAVRSSVQRIGPQCRLRNPCGKGRRQIAYANGVQLRQQEGHRD